MSNLSKTKTLLKKYTQIPGISGVEEKITNEIIKDIKPFCDDAYISKSGSVIGIKKATIKSSSSKLLFDAHIDEIGLIVTKIEDNGFIRFSRIGGYDPKILPGQEVVVYGTTELMGIIGSIPPHFKEEKKFIPINELFIDVGLPYEKVIEKVRVGDMVSIRSEFTELKNDLCSTKCLDNRAGLVSLILTVENLSKSQLSSDVYFLFSTQEEWTGVGAQTGSYSIFPDAAIVVDVTHADVSGMGTQEIPRIGSGVVIAIGPDTHPKIHNKLIEIATAEEIPHTIEPHPKPSGTNTGAIQLAREGILTGLVSIPLRYMHTPVEVVSPADIERTARLLTRFAENFSTEILGETS